VLRIQVHDFFKFCSTVAVEFDFKTEPEPDCCSRALSNEGCDCMNSRFTISSLLFNHIACLLLTLLSPRSCGHNQAVRKKEKNWQRSREYHQRKAAAQLLIEEAFAVKVPHPRVSPPPSPSSTPSPPLPPPVHRAVRPLALVDIVESSSAPNPKPSTSTSVDDSCPEQRLDVDALASPASESPINQCSQQNEPALEKVSDWLRRVKAAERDVTTPSAETSESTFPRTVTLPAAPHKDQYASESDCSSYCISEGGRPASLAPRKDQYVSESDCSSYCISEGGRRYRSVPAKLLIDGKLYVHKDYTGRLPLCYYSTGLQKGSSHDVYECFDRRDIMWARRLRFHIDQLSNHKLRDEA
jgi:hypothetical protein